MAWEEPNADEPDESWKSGAETRQSDRRELPEEVKLEALSAFLDRKRNPRRICERLLEAWRRDSVQIRIWLPQSGRFELLTHVAPKITAPELLERACDVRIISDSHYMNRSKRSWMSVALGKASFELHCLLPKLVTENRLKIAIVLIGAGVSICLFSALDSVPE